MKKIILEAEKFFNDNIPNNRIKSYYLNHIQSVRHYGKLLADEYKADHDIIEIAAILHDMGAEQGKIHAQASAEIAKKFLMKFNIDNKIVSKIISAIANHSSEKPSVPYKKDVGLEGNILRDADVLSFFDDGYMGYYKQKTEKMTNSEAKQVTLDKMVKMKQKITTSLGIKLANNKHKVAVNDFESIN